MENIRNISAEKYITMLNRKISIINYGNNNVDKENNGYSELLTRYEILSNEALEHDRKNIKRKKLDIRG